MGGRWGPRWAAELRPGLRAAVMCVVKEPWAGVRPWHCPFLGTPWGLSLSLSEPQFSYLEKG